jgi:hypothetical protein
LIWTWSNPAESTPTSGIWSLPRPCLCKPPLIMDAVCRNITIVGEAARKLDEPFQRAHPQRPWSRTIGAEHRHARLRVPQSRVYRTGFADEIEPQAVRQAGRASLTPAPQYTSISGYFPPDGRTSPWPASPFRSSPTVPAM